MAALYITVDEDSFTFTCIQVNHEIVSGINMTVLMIGQ